jgi:two-component system cell cycle sensor histidine kinase/response regulator CckA
MQGLLKRLIGEHIKVAWQPAKNLAPVRGDPSKLEQVILNLALNARDAMPEGGTLSIQTSNVVADIDRAEAGSIDSSRYVMLTFSDTGIGLSDDVREHLFEPFYTTKEAGRGTGLGLATVYGIVTQSGGSISVQSHQGYGTTFTILLPSNDASIGVTNADSSPVSVPGTEDVVLVVEDDPDVRGVTCNILTRNGYTILEANDGQEAIAVAMQHLGPIHLLLTDLVMPGMNGSDLASQFLQIRPEGRVLYMSGYTVHTRDDNGSNPASDRTLITKPFTPHGLLWTVHAVLDK